MTGADAGGQPWADAPVERGQGAWRIDLGRGDERNMAIVVLTLDEYDALCTRANDKATVAELRRAVVRQRERQHQAQARAFQAVRALQEVAALLQTTTHPQHLLQYVRQAIAADHAAQHPRKLAP